MSLEHTLAGVVGERHCLVDADIKASYEVDWSGRFRGMARCVVRPADTAEVAEVLRACHAAGVPVTVQGGNTGLVGGGVPAGGEVLLSLARLDQLEPVDTVAAQVTVGAGVRLEALARHARAAGLDFGVDLASRSQATVGGLVATNAGGVRVVQHGAMRAQVVGLEAVLADGTVLRRLSPPVKDNTGYDLTQLLCGSEGTLAVLTRVRVHLVPPPSQAATALVGLAGTPEAVALLERARHRLTVLAAAEVFYAEGLSLVRAVERLPAPLSTEFPAYLLLEAAGRGDPMTELLDLLADCDLVGDATMADDASGRTRLWAYREKHTEAINATAVPVKLDVCVPLPRLATCVEKLAPTVAEADPAARLIVFGHVAEGSLHVNLLGVDDPERGTDAVLRLVAAHGGSISAEHGIGRAKVAWLGLSRSPEEIAAMRRVKDAFDPTHLLNPGVLLPAVAG